MTAPQDGTTPQVATPTVSTAPTSGATPPAARGRWRWGSVPDHLGRARTSTVVLSLLFLAVFTLYLAVRPDETGTGTDPAGGSSDVEAPVDPVVPLPTTTPEPTDEPAPTTGTDRTPTPSPTTEAPPTSPGPTSTTPGTTAPSSTPAEPTGTSGTAGPTAGETEEDAPATSAPATP